MTAKIMHFSAEVAATAPLNFSYQLTPTIALGTTVTGTGRQTATVNILNGTLSMWATTLMQTVPNAELPFDLIIGDTTIKAGAVFRLTIPTTQQMGNVSVMCTVITPTTPSGTVFSAQIASWPLNSATPTTE